MAICRKYWKCQNTTYTAKSECVRKNSNFLWIQIIDIFFGKFSCQNKESFYAFQELLIKQSYKVKIDNIKWEFLSSPWDFSTNKFVFGSNIFGLSSRMTLIEKYFHCPNFISKLFHVLSKYFPLQFPIWFQIYHSFCID